MDLTLGLKKVEKPEEEEVKPIVSPVLPPELETVDVTLPPELSPPKKKTHDTAESAEMDENLSFSELSSDAEYNDMLREYMIKRFGESGAQKEDETNEEYLKRFLTHAREFEFNSIDLARQLDWVRTANQEDRIKFGYLYSQLERLPSFYEEGGTGYLSAVRDFGKSLVTDPLNYIGFGGGAIANKVATRAVIEGLKTGGKKLALEEAAKYSAKRMLGTKAGKIAAVGVGVEAGLAGVQDLKLQELEMLSQKYGEYTDTEYDYGRAAISGGLGLALGTAGYKLSGGLGTDRIFSNANEAFTKQKNIAARLKSGSKEAVDEATKRTEEATSQTATGIFDLNAGREALDILGNVDDTTLTQAEFNIEVMKRVGKVVTETVQELADNGRLGAMVDEDTKASEVIGQVITDRLQALKDKPAEEIRDQTAKMLAGEGEDAGLLARLDMEDEGFDDALQAAISRAGLTNEQFINAMGASYSNAGQFLQTASNVGKIMKRMGKLDPELENILKTYSSAEKVANPLNGAIEFGRRLDRERRALMVTQIATTVRNVATGAARVTMETAADAIESALYQFGRGAEAARTGNQALGSGNTKDIFRDAYGRLNRLARVSNTTMLADDLLRHNRRLAGRMDRTLQEVSDDETLSAFARTMNLLNTAQDQFFRRGIFVNSIDKKLRRAGVIVDNPTKAGQFKNLDEFVASGKTLPASVLSDSIDEALEFTFSKMPDGNTIGGQFVRFTEKVGPLPLGPLPNTAMFPFARFMVNALKFQYDFSPASTLSYLSRRHTAKQYDKMAQLAKTSEEKTKLSRQAAAQMQEARTALSKSVVGTAAFGAAIHQRANNQDVKFYEYKTDDGRIADLRPYFPLTPYLAIADLIVKSANGDLDKANIREVLEAFTGAQFRTGASSYVIENFGEAFLSPLSGDTPSTERVGELVGGFVAEMTGGYLTPARIVRDVQAAFDTEAAILRDAKQTSGMGMDERFYSALKNGIYKDMPELSKQLPALESPTRESDVYRQQPLLGQLGAPRMEDVRNPAEEEFTRLGIERYTIGARTGDKSADAFVNRYLGKFVEDSVSKLVTSDMYQAMTDAEKRAALNNEMKRVRKFAKQLGEFESETVMLEEGKSFTPFDRAQYGKLTDNQTRLADAYYKEKHGKTVLEMVEAEPDVNHYKIATDLGRLLEKNL